MRSVKWENLREEEFEDAIKESGGLCVMCLGCLEKHGQHLPVGTDSLKGDKIVELAAERAGVVMFPTTMWLGDVCSSHAFEDPSKTKKHGFIGMNPRTLLTVLEELCDEIARNGFTKILLCASHGGNTNLLGLFQRQQLYRKRNYATMVCKAYDFAKQLKPENMLEEIKARPNDFPMITDEDLKTLERFAETGTGGGHGDLRETMLVYGTHPDLVAPERFDAVDGSNQGVINLSKMGVDTLLAWEANYPNVLGGYASTGCTRTLGEAAVKLSVERLSEIFTYVKNDEGIMKAVEMHKGQ